MPGLGAQQYEQPLPFVQRLRFAAAGNRVGKCRIARIGKQLTCHLRRLQHRIGNPGGDCTTRHAVVCRGGRVLHQHQPPLALDRAHAQRAVGSGAGEYYAHRRVARFLCQRPEKVVDREPQVAWAGRIEQLQPLVENR